MPSIIVQSATSVLVAGTHYGPVADTIANNPALASGVQIALEAWEESCHAAHDRRVEELTADAKREGERAAAALAEFAAYKADVERASSAIKAVISDAAVDDTATVERVAQIVAITEVEANKTTRERELAEKLAAKAALDAEIAALQ